MNGTCCAFSFDSMSPAQASTVSNCTACNNASRPYSSYYGTSNLQYQCSACKAGSQLFSGGGYSSDQCQQTCDPATEFRYSSTSLFCSKKSTAGSYCSSAWSYGRGWHSSTFQPNLGWLRQKMQPQHPLLPLNTSLTPYKQPLTIPTCAPYPAKSADVDSKIGRV